MKKTISIKMLATLGLLVAVHVVLSRFCSINAWNIKIGFSFVPVFVSAYLFGPLAAGIVGALGDFVGATLFPIGAYFPGFTLTCFLSGILFGLLLYKKLTVLRILCAVLINQFVLGLILNTLWISMLYGAPYESLFTTRVVQSAIMTPIEFVTVSFLAKSLLRRMKEMLL